MLWRATCPMEQRYVVAPSCEKAMELARKQWETAAKTDPRWQLSGLEMVSAADPLK